MVLYASLRPSLWSAVLLVHIKSSKRFIPSTLMWEYKLVLALEKKVCGAGRRGEEGEIYCLFTCKNNCAHSFQCWEYHQFILESAISFPLSVGHSKIRFLYISIQRPVRWPSTRLIISFSTFWTVFVLSFLLFMLKISTAKLLPFSSLTTTHSQYVDLAIVRLWVKATNLHDRNTSLKCNHCLSMLHGGI